MLSPKTIKDLHGILHKALNQTAAIGYLGFNPADACNIPKVVRKELTPLDTEDIQKFLTEIRGNPFEILLSVTLFMGLREGEVLALSWHNIDFEHGTVLINCQLQRFRGGTGVYRIVPTKNSKGRTIKPATAVMNLLKRQKAIQAEMRLKAGTAWKIMISSSQMNVDITLITRPFAALLKRPQQQLDTLTLAFTTYGILTQSPLSSPVMISNCAIKSRSRNCCLYSRHLRSCHRANEAGKFGERMDNFIKSVSGGEK